MSYFWSAAGLFEGGVRSGGEIGQSTVVSRDGGGGEWGVGGVSWQLAEQT